MRTLLLTIACIFIIVSGLAQESTKDFCSICKDHTHHESPPYKLTFKREIPFIISSGAILGTGFIVAAHNKTKPFTIEELATLNVRSINAFDRGSVYNYSPSSATTSDYIRTGITILPILLLSEHHTKQDIAPLLAMSVEVMAVTYGITTTVKNLVNRARPNVYNSLTPMSERTSAGSRQSFFSGHTSHTAAASFFVAKIISDYHPNMNKGTKIALWSVSSFVPAMTAYLRVQSGKHFPTDVMAGYAAGALTGWLIPHLHKVKKDGPLSKINLQVYPSNNGMQFSFQLGL